MHLRFLVELYHALIVSLSKMLSIRNILIYILFDILKYTFNLTSVFDSTVSYFLQVSKLLDKNYYYFRFNPFHNTNVYL